MTKVRDVLYSQCIDHTCFLSGPLVKERGLDVDRRYRLNKQIILSGVQETFL